jgi:hypothetical protein
VRTSPTAQSSIEARLGSATRERVVRYLLASRASSRASRQFAPTPRTASIGQLEMSQAGESIFRIVAEVAAQVQPELASRFGAGDPSAACRTAWAEGWFGVKGELIEMIRDGIGDVLQRHRQRLELCIGVHALESEGVARLLGGLVALCVADPPPPQKEASEVFEVEIATRIFVDRCGTRVLKRAHRFCGGTRTVGIHVQEIATTTASARRRADLVNLRKSLKVRSDQIESTWIQVAEICEIDEVERRVLRSHKRWWTDLMSQDDAADPPLKSEWVREVNWLLRVFRDGNSSSPRIHMPREEWVTDTRLCLAEIGNSVSPRPSRSSDEELASNIDLARNAYLDWVYAMARVAVEVKQRMEVDDFALAKAWAQMFGPSQGGEPEHPLVQMSWLAIGEAMSDSQHAEALSQCLPVEPSRRKAQQTLFDRQVCALVMSALEWPAHPDLADVLEELLDRLTNDAVLHRPQTVVNVERLVSTTVAPMRAAQARLARLLEELPDQERQFAAYAISSKAYAVFRPLGPNSLGLRENEPYIGKADDSRRTVLSNYVDEVLERHRKILTDLLAADSGPGATRGIVQAEGLQTRLVRENFNEIYEVVQAKRPLVKDRSPAACPDIGYLFGSTFRNAVYRMSEDMEPNEKAIIRPLLTVPFTRQWDGSGGWFLPKVRKAHVEWVLTWHGFASTDFGLVLARLKRLSVPTSSRSVV